MLLVTCEHLKNMAEDTGSLELFDYDIYQALLLKSLHLHSNAANF